MNYKISIEAEKDLENIWLFTLENWSIEQADYYFDLMMNEINPKFGQDFGEVRKGYFCSRIKSHFIFYRINLKNNDIEIIRILHQQMDVDSQLNV